MRTDPHMGLFGGKWAFQTLEMLVNKASDTITILLARLYTYVNSRLVVITFSRMEEFD